jgi:hypothetical protein
MAMSLGAFGAAAQGPAGVGADEASKSSHSSNPVKWVKKDKKTASEKPATVKPASEKSNTTQNASAKHSLNPIKWIKKSPQQSAQKKEKAKNKNSSARPETQDASAPTPGA